MLRHLARLTARVRSARDACAIAVYADARSRSFPAADLGYEGVACVDDAARAAVLFCDVFAATGNDRIRTWAEAMVAFLFHMQDRDGRFTNFIVDWEGRRNTTGPTSYPGGGFWHARGARGLAKAWLVLGDERAKDGLVRGIEVIRSARDVPADVRAIHAIMAVELGRDGRMGGLREDLGRWCDEIASLRRGDVLLDNPDETEPHLWGHLQEGVLADAGALLGRPALVDVARRSALAYLAPLIESAFEAPTIQPYGVGAAVYCVDRLAAVTGDARFADLTQKARAWFAGRNPAHRAVYDRRRGRVHDGIDDGALNPHSGAESNIVGAQALIDDVIASVPSLIGVVEACFMPAVRKQLGVAPIERSA